METDQFHEWFLNIFLAAVQGRAKMGSAILLVDGHNSYLELELLRLARTNNVTIYFLPANTTHLLQPLDIGVFGLVKRVCKRNA